MTDLTHLLESAQGGDLDATGELLERFQGMATSYAWSVLGDFHLAQDAVQAAFIEACGQLSRVYSARALPAWLRRLVFKQCDRIRRTARDRTASLDDVDLPAGEVEASLRLEDFERVRRVRVALARLPDLERLDALLRYYQMCSRGEIAAFLELSLDQVAYRLRSAHRLFRKEMATMPETAASSVELAAAGRDALTSIGDGNPHPQLAASIGRLREQVSLGNVAPDGAAQNLLQHSLEVARLAGQVAERLGLDASLARRAGLLHDLGKVLEGDDPHPQLGARTAADLAEDPQVVAAIADHHERGERLEDGCFLLDVTPLCFAVCAADTFSADRFADGDAATPADPTLGLVALPGGSAHAFRYLFGLELRVLVHGDVPDRRAAAVRVAAEARHALAFAGKVRVTYAP